jgi:hypothetical protein
MALTKPGASRLQGSAIVFGVGQTRVTSEVGLMKPPLTFWLYMLYFGGPVKLIGTC